MLNLRLKSLTLKKFKGKVGIFSKHNLLCRKMATSCPDYFIMHEFKTPLAADLRWRVGLWGVYTIQQTHSKLPANVFKIHVLMLDVCWIV